MFNKMPPAEFTAGAFQAITITKVTTNTMQKKRKRESGTGTGSGVNRGRQVTPSLWQ